MSQYTSTNVARRARREESAPGALAGQRERGEGEQRECEQQGSARRARAWQMAHPPERDVEERTQRVDDRGRQNGSRASRQARNTESETAGLPEGQDRVAESLPTAAAPRALVVARKPSRPLSTQCGERLAWARNGLRHAPRASPPRRPRQDPPRPSVEGPVAAPHAAPASTSRPLLQKPTASGAYCCMAARPGRAAAQRSPESTPRRRPSWCRAATRVCSKSRHVASQPSQYSRVRKSDSTTSDSRYTSATFSPCTRPAGNRTGAAAA